MDYFVRKLIRKLTTTLPSQFYLYDAIYSAPLDLEGEGNITITSGEDGEELDAESKREEDDATFKE